MIFVALAILFFFAALISLWFVSFAIRRTGQMRPFLPLVALQAGIASVAALFYYELLFTVWQTYLSFLVLIAYCWFLVDLLRKHPTPL